MNDAERTVIVNHLLQSASPAERAGGELIKSQAAELTRLRGWQQTALLWLPKCGTGCQCQGEHDCELKVLRRQATAATKRKGNKWGETPNAYDLSNRNEGRA